MNKILFICCALLQLEWITAKQHQVPANIMNHLKSAKTHAEFLQHIQVVNPTPTAARIISEDGTSGSLRAPGDGTSRSAHKPELELKSDMLKTQLAQLPDDGMDLIDEPRQSGDSCKAFVHCVPVPLKTKPGVVYFPRCIDMPTCTGGCCENTNNCKATKKKKVRVTVKEYVYKGNGDFTGPEISHVVMENHTECQCTSCRVPRDAMEQCGENQKWEGCQCVCTNSDDAESCTGENRIWSTDRCACQCRSNICPGGHFLDPQTCRCRSISDVNGGRNTLLTRDTVVDETVITIN